MGIINMPPGGGGPDIKHIKPIEYCQQYENDPLFIKVSDPGFMAHFPPGCFSPDLPSGFVFPSSTPLGPFNPVKNNTTVYLAYFDFSSQRLFIENLNIRTVCTDTGLKKKSVKKSKAKK